jgi:hypothetical protein
VHFQLQTIYPRIRIVATSQHFSNHTLAAAVFSAKLRIPEARSTNFTVNDDFVGIAADTAKFLWQTSSHKRYPKEPRIRIGTSRLPAD